MQVLLFKGTSDDSNRDGLLNEKDLQSLYVYNLKKEKMRKCSFPQASVIYFEDFQQKRKVLVRTGTDINQDGNYDSVDEPANSYLYDPLSEKMHPVVSKKVQQTLQQLLAKQRN